MIDLMPRTLLVFMQDLNLDLIGQQQEQQLQLQPLHMIPPLGLTEMPMNVGVPKLVPTLMLLLLRLLSLDASLTLPPRLSHIVTKLTGGSCPHTQLPQHLTQHGKPNGEVYAFLFALKLETKHLMIVGMPHQMLQQLMLQPKWQRLEPIMMLMMSSLSYQLLTLVYKGAVSIQTMQLTEDSANV